MTRSVYRFAPSPNGELHLGHAYSALLNAGMAAEAEGRFLLRMEDIDLARCSPLFEAGIRRDLAWLGIEWDEPVRRQSEHFADYSAALYRLIEADLVYPAFMSRRQVMAFVAEAAPSPDRPWPRDPDGAFHYPGSDKMLSGNERRRRIAEGMAFSWRLDVQAACRHAGTRFTWRETGCGPAGQTGKIAGDPSVWGDAVIARSDAPGSYHLCVVVDDALQGVTHVVRGRDLFHATALHRLLQQLLGLPAPDYHHHDLICDAHGHKLSKSRGDTGLATLREAGATPVDIMRMVGLPQFQPQMPG